MCPKLHDNMIGNVDFKRRKVLTVSRNYSKSVFRLKTLPPSGVNGYCTPFLTTSRAFYAPRVS